MSGAFGSYTVSEFWVTLTMEINKQKGVGIRFQIVFET